jgi:ATP-binding cassette subfamily B protein
MVSYKELIGFAWKFMRQQKWLFFAIFLIDCFVFSVDALIWPYILHLVIDIFTQYEGDRLAAWGALRGPIIGGVCLVIYIEVAARGMGFLMARAIPKLQADIRMTMFNHVQHHSPHYFNERFAGSLANKMTDMTTQVESIIQQLFWPIVPTISTCVLAVGFLWFINPIFALIMLAWIAIHLGVCLTFTKRCDFYEQRHNFAVNLFYRFKFERHAIGPFQNEEKETNVQARWYVEKMRCYLSVFYFVAVVLGVNGSLLYLWVHNHLTTGQVIQVFTTMWSIVMLLWTVGSALPALFQSFGIAKQAYTVMLDPQDMGDKLDAPELKIASGEIAFENVSFHYGEKKLFHNKHARIKGGEKVGLVGYTGAGKSTFVSLILRFYPVESGRILIDGQDIADITLESLRSKIALNPQDPVLFHRSLRENIAYGNPDATEEQILRVARLAHCDEFIRNIPQGYDAKVGERGTKLSGGEKQRIAIARAILADAPILILDEATSSLDSGTEKYIQESLEKLMQNRTTIVIAHRLSTLARMDRILVFDKGKIVEEGTHAALLSKDGLYAKMWHMQVGGFLPETPL